jgi:hypothetical protein
MILSHSLTWIQEWVVELVLVVFIPPARRLSIYLFTDGDQLIGQLIQSPRQKCARKKLIENSPNIAQSKHMYCLVELL